MNQRKSTSLQILYAQIYVAYKNVNIQPKLSNSTH